MNRSTPGLPVHHQLPEFTQTHVHRVGDAIQPSHPLSSPSPAPNPSQHQSLFLKMSFFTQVVLSMAVIFQLSYNPRTPEEHGIYSNHTAVRLIQMGESRGEGPQVKTTTLGKQDFLMVQIMF